MCGDAASCVVITFDKKTRSTLKVQLGEVTVIIILWNLGGQSEHGKFVSFLPGGHKDFQSHIKCHEYQHFLKTKIQISQGPPCWLQLVTWSDCSELHHWRVIKQPKHWQSCFLWFMQSLHIFFPCWTHCDTLYKVIMHCSDIKCIKLKSRASWLRVTNLVRMASI